MAGYYGKRFYRVTWERTLTGKRESMSFDDRRSEAKAHASRTAASPHATAVRIETLDDRYPANVLASESVEVSGS